MASINSGPSQAVLNSSFMSSHSQSPSQAEDEERNRAIRDVSAKIEGLNAILKRTGDVVAQQG